MKCTATLLSFLANLLAMSLIELIYFYKEDLQQVIIHLQNETHFSQHTVGKQMFAILCNNTDVQLCTFYFSFTDAFKIIESILTKPSYSMLAS